LNAGPTGPVGPATEAVTDPVTDPIIVPQGELSADALRGVVEAFVLREGTDYGAREYSLEQKVHHVLGQLDRGEAQILFDPGTESVQIVRARSCRTR
jgi:uncharacterized protein YheU (UPF0270 family)